jgi:hypothetical protein
MACGYGFVYRWCLTTIRWTRRFCKGDRNCIYSKFTRMHVYLTLLDPAVIVNTSSLRDAVLFRSLPTLVSLSRSSLPHCPYLSRWSCRVLLNSIPHDWLRILTKHSFAPCFVRLIGGRYIMVTCHTATRGESVTYTYVNYPNLHATRPAIRHFA